MKIIEFYKIKKPVLSFEVFPPKPDLPLETVFNTLDDLKHLNPDFISVTYGAGGGTRIRTIEISSKIKNHLHIEPLSHLTCITATTNQIDDILDDLKNKNIENILALRGDIPKDIPNFDFPVQSYRYAKDLIVHIKRVGDFCIGAACYPEGHIEAVDKETDIFYLKQKIEAGADFLITQLFYDNNIFYSFLNQIRSIGITCPVSAGIMPIFNTKQIEKIISLCRVSIPKEVKDILDKYKDNSEDLIKAGIEYAINQILDLIKNGVDGIHLYTMNKSEQVKEIVKMTFNREIN